MFGAGLALLVAETVLRTVALGLLFYRPQELLQRYDADRGHWAYRRSAAIEMVVYGDLVALAAGKIDIELRREDFRVDSYGFRNDQDYSDQPYLLVGDSFVVGTGTAQSEILSAQLRQQCRLRAYNLAFPGGFLAYMSYVNEFQKRHRGRPRVVLFVFEGNDFPEPDEASSRAARRPRWWTAVEAVHAGLRDVPLVRESLLPRVLYRTLRSLGPESLRDAVAAGDLVTSWQIGVHRVGELTEHVGVTDRPHYKGRGDIEAALFGMREALALIVFIPTKYRVYRDFIAADARQQPLPEAQWRYLEALAARLAVPAINLTEPLVSEAARALREEGRFVYWKDDSHWNGRGIRVAAKAVCRALDGPAVSFGG